MTTHMHVFATSVPFDARDPSLDRLIVLGDEIGLFSGVYGTLVVTHVDVDPEWDRSAFSCALAVGQVLSPWKNSEPVWWMSSCDGCRDYPDVPNPWTPFYVTP